MNGPYLLPLALSMLVLGAASPLGAASERTWGEIPFAPCTVDVPGQVRTFAAECARLTVIEDPKVPEGRKLELNLALIPARAPKAEPDPVVFLAGGPGQSAIEAYAGIAAALDAVNAQRDLLLIDQRGTGGSNPLPCPLPDWRITADSVSEELRSLASDCVRDLSERANLARYTTSDAVRDLETVRLALGSPQFNLYGASYGTRVALEYLRRHPDGVRSVIIDGVVPPTLALGQDHARNLEQAIERIFNACRVDPDCADRFGDPAVTLAELRTRIRNQPLSASVPGPLDHHPNQEQLDENGLIGVLRFYAYQPEFASLLPLLIDEAARGRPQALIGQGLILFRDFQDQLMHGMELSVLCSEDADRLVRRPEDADTLMAYALNELVEAQCPVWPAGPRPADFKQPVTSDKPVLILSGEWDPVTPARYGDEVLASLPKARHLVAKGRGHIVLTAGCMPRLAREFIDGLDVEAIDATCLDVLQPPPFFTGFHGSQP